MEITKEQFKEFMRQYIAQDEDSGAQMLDNALNVMTDIVCGNQVRLQSIRDFVVSKLDKEELLKSVQIQVQK